MKTVTLGDNIKPIGLINIKLKGEMPVKALALLSGGLDSTLAIKVLQEQGIEVEAINFTSPFCLCSGSKGNCHAATEAAEHLAVKLYKETCGQAYLDMIANPVYGYGRQVNPCLDCRIFKLNRAKEKMDEIGASFLVTGEVLDQRPMSQRRDTLSICERDTGLRGLILRPLSARLLPPTVPEEQGWVDREKLLAIQGRGRRPQMDLAQNMGITDYPCPGGGCLLTYAEFAIKVRELLTQNQRLTPWNTSLLRVGRHFRLPEGSKVVVGRNEEENRKIKGLAGQEHVYLESFSHPGPSALIDGEISTDILQGAAGIIGRYIQTDGLEGPFTVSYKVPGQSVGLLEISPFPAAKVNEWLIGAV